ncbi:tetratricopeptide repeat protein [Acinetobacter faecalis]|uniref:tetratricopeptide repeat protein n=1 Tax=Acinetobacter faecalis TaxID=2665161 RepID=UPI002A917812|nr:tetratricopeptide repeat protein [Acinetobacter faecalis]MDY6450466.1 tetratricopeptide repeat protein [Acinetobacter faecalis]
MYKIVLSTCMILGLVGCQNLPMKSDSKKTDSTTKPQAKEIRNANGVVIKTYELDEIKREKLHTAPSSTTKQKLEDGESLPAYKNLMSQAKTSYNAGQFDKAEGLILQAQRLAPQSADTYLYLSLVALQKNNAKNAESLARRGLSFAQTNTMKRQLWLTIQRAAQKQNNAKSVAESKTALKSL